MIIINQYLNEEKHRYEVFIENLYCGVLLYHFVKYDNVIKQEFIKKVIELLEDYFNDDSILTPKEMKERISIFCKQFNIIQLQIERG